MSACGIDQDRRAFVERHLDFDRVKLQKLMAEEGRILLVEAADLPAQAAQIGIALNGQGEAKQGDLAGRQAQRPGQARAQAVQRKFLGQAAQRVFHLAQCRLANPHELTAPVRLLILVIIVVGADASTRQQRAAVALHQRIEVRSPRTTQAQVRLLGERLRHQRPQHEPVFLELGWAQVIEVQSRKTLQHGRLPVWYRSPW